MGRQGLGAIGTFEHSLLALRTLFQLLTGILLVSIPLSPRVHIRAVALDLLTEAVHPSSSLQPYILELATRLWENSSAVHLLCSAAEILPETEALTLQGWTARNYPGVYLAFVQLQQSSHTAACVHT